MRIPKTLLARIEAAVLQAAESRLVTEARKTILDHKERLEAAQETVRAVERMHAEARAECSRLNVALESATVEHRKVLDKLERAEWALSQAEEQRAALIRAVVATVTR